jgi:hypothetical protein
MTIPAGKVVEIGLQSGCCAEKLEIRTNITDPPKTAAIAPEKVRLLPSGIVSRAAPSRAIGAGGRRMLPRNADAESSLAVGRKVIATCPLLDSIWADS